MSLFVLNALHAKLPCTCHIKLLQALSGAALNATVGFTARYRIGRAISSVPAAAQKKATINALSTR
jgi:hypothetical protein